MKKMNNILSIILSICMIVQVLPVWAAEGNTNAVTGNGAASQITYLYNEDFGEDDIGEWVLNGDSTKVSLESKPVTGDDGNYALTYTSTAVFNTTYASVAIPDAKFETNKEIVVKTRIMPHIDSGGRFQFKFNREANGGAEANYSAGMLFRLDPDKFFYVTRIATSGSWDQTSINPFTAYSDVWFDVELRFTDDETVTLKMTREGTNEIVDRPLVLATKNQTAINDIFLRLGSGTVSVDYLKVYEVYHGKMEIDGSYAPGEEIDVTFNMPLNKAFTNVEEAVKLYDDNGNVVDSSVTADVENNTVTIVPENNITEGEYYTVKLDESKTTLNSIFDTKEKQFYASNNKYIIYDDFNNGKLGNWKLGETTVTEDNYAYGVENGEMYLDLKTKVANEVSSDIPTLINDFKDSIYQEGKNIVVKTKIRSTGDTGTHRSQLKLNRPDVSTLNYAEQNEFWYALGVLRGDGYQVTNPSYHSGGVFVYQAVSGTTTKDEWIEVETKLDGVNKIAYTTVVVNGKTYGPTKSTLAEDKENAYTLAGVDPEVGFTSFDSLTWVPRGFETNKLYVDYIYAYVEETVKPSLSVGTVYNDKDIVVRLDNAVNYLPVGAVVLKNSEGNEVEGITTTNNTASKTISVHSEELLPAGNYTIVFDDSQINEVFTTKELTVEILNNTKMEIDGSYAPGEEIDVTFNVPINKVFTNAEEAVKLYDDNGNVVDSSVTANVENNTVTIVPENNITEGEYYTVALDESKISEGYEFAANQKQFYASKSKYIIYDDFNNGKLGNWKLGETTVTEDKYAYGVENGEMYLDLKTKVANEVSSDIPTLINDFKDSIYQEGKIVVLKTKIKSTGDTGTHRSQLKLNRPDVSTFNYAEQNEFWYALGALRGDGYQVTDSEAHEKGIFVYRTAEGTSTKDKWIEVETKLDGVNKIAYTTIVIDGKTYGPIQSTLEECDRAYAAAGADPADGFMAFDSLTWIPRGVAANKLYVDYIYAYAEDVTNPSVAADASVSLTVNGKEVTTPTRNETVIPKFSVKTLFGTSNKYALISAMYVDGKLEDIHIKQMDGDNIEYTEPVGFELGYDVSNVVIKAFIWGGENGMIPVCEPAVIQPAETNKVYVETLENGGNDDTGTGAQDAPVASVAKALTITSGIPNSEIIVGGGNYYLSDRFAVNSDNNYLKISAAEGEIPVFTVGQAIALNDSSKVKKVSETEQNSAIRSRLSHHSNVDIIMANLYEIDLKGINIPAVSLPGVVSYSADGLAMANGTFTIEEARDNTCEVFINDKAMTIARYPNASDVNPYTTVATVKQQGAVTRNWMDDKENTEGYVSVDNRIATPFVITDARAQNWQSATDALAFGYWMFDWAGQTIPISVSGSDITSKYPSHYGIQTGQRYYVFNLIEEIDEAGEYYIDRSNSKMYIYMPENLSVNDEIIITTENKPMMTIPGSHVVVDGLKFSGTRSNAIAVYGNKNVVKNCEISNTAKTAVKIEHGVENLIKDCYIHDVNGGIYLSDGNFADLTSGNNQIINNEISNFARINKTYTPAVDLYSVGALISNNKIYDSEHMAISINGINNEISYNEIYDVCKETEDSGAIYAGGSWVKRGNKILYNYFHDIKSVAKQVYGVAAVFLDDHMADVYIKGNVFANIEGDGVRGNKGREHTITNNIFVNCSLNGAKITSDSNPVASNYTNMENAVKQYIGNSVWEEEYQILFTKDDNGQTIVNTAELMYGNDNEYTKNLAVICGEAYTFGDYASQHGTINNNFSTNDDPGFVNMENGNLAINAETVQALGIEGFEVIPFAQVGRK